MRSVDRHLAADLTELLVDAVTACQEVRQVTNIVTTVEAHPRRCAAKVRTSSEVISSRRNRVTCFRQAESL